MVDKNPENKARGGWLSRFAPGVRKIVMSSSPSTRFDGSDVDGLTEAQMPPTPRALAAPCVPS